MKLDWTEKSRRLIYEACTRWGIKASTTDTTNYGSIFCRDAVMAGIAGVLLEDKIIIEGFKNTLKNLKLLQGEQGQIASNFKIKDGQVDHVSYGTLSPKIDSCTWYLIGVGYLVKEGLLRKEDYQESVIKTIALLDGIEYNGKNLMYVPKGGNWADEYTYEGFVMYDQILRAWGLALLGHSFGNGTWIDKSTAIIETIKTRYVSDDNIHFLSSFFPGGTCNTFDLAAHTLAAIVMEEKSPLMDNYLDWIIDEYIYKGVLPPAFSPVIDEGHRDWDTLQRFHMFGFKNEPHHYHNGGIWWIWTGWLAVALSMYDKQDALDKLVATSFNYLDKADDFQFDEYLSADKLEPNGTKKLCYTATGIIFLSLAKKSFDFSSLSPMSKSTIKEHLVLKEKYFEVSSQLLEQIQETDLLKKEKLVIAVAGESGSGKSVTAKCLQIELNKLNISSVILHQDSYYVLPPKENHEKRKEDIAWVGANEVKLDLMQDHIEQFRAGAEGVMVSVVDYVDNSFSELETSFDDVQVLLVEGCYTFLLENIDYKIFMERSYIETLEKRKSRSREVYDPFVEKVLVIEHKLVSKLGKTADATVSKKYEVKKGVA